MDTNLYDAYRNLGWSNEEIWNMLSEIEGISETEGDDEEWQ